MDIFIFPVPVLVMVERAGDHRIVQKDKILNGDAGAHNTHLDKEISLGVRQGADGTF